MSKTLFSPKKFRSGCMEYSSGTVELYRFFQSMVLAVNSIHEGKVYVDSVRRYLSAHLHFPVCTVMTSQVRTSVKLLET